MFAWKLFALLAGVFLAKTG